MKFDDEASNVICIKIKKLQRIEGTCHFHQLSPENIYSIKKKVFGNKGSHPFERGFRYSRVC